jgi:hypothetical protein
VDNDQVQNFVLELDDLDQNDPSMMTTIRKVIEPHSLFSMPRKP